MKEEKELSASIRKLAENHTLEKEEYRALILGMKSLMEEMRPDQWPDLLLFQKAREVREAVYGKAVFLRGLIEFTNICKNNCYYCGIRCGNEKVERYRLTKEQILSCADQGYDLGFRTIVLQGGEDPYYTRDILCQLIREIKAKHPDCALTLSIGERDKADYQAFYQAGADRYLLRHETANEDHYGKLHPSNLSLAHRKQCLLDLKEIGYQIGCGMMLGSPYQTLENLLEDIEYMKDLKPHMIGIGPFIPHKDTPFKEAKAGTLLDTVLFLAILRLTFPKVLLPATTALGTIHPQGRELGILAGANVVMPNLSPSEVRGKYLLYDGKICTGDEAAECHTCMERRMQSIGYEVVTDRGDYRG